MKCCLLFPGRAFFRLLSGHLGLLVVLLFFIAGGRSSVLSQEGEAAAGGTNGTDAAVSADAGVVTAEEQLQATMVEGMDPATELEAEVIAQHADTVLKMDAPIAETPRSVSVITRQQIEDRGVQTVQDALLYTPGVYGAAYGYDTRGDWAQIRGVEPLDYIDGLRSLFDYYNNTRPHPYALSSVDVVKGPASVLYGQSTIGGILNSTTKRPESRPYNEVFVSYGTHDRFETGLDIGGRLDQEGRLLWRLVGVNRDSESQVDYVPDDTWFVAPSLTWLPTDDTSLTVLANFQEYHSGTSLQFLPWEGTVLPGRRIPPNRFLSEPGFDRYDTEQQSVTGIFTHRFDEVFSVEARARYTNGNADYRSLWPSFPPTIMADGTIDRTAYVSFASSEAFVTDARVRAQFETGGAFHHAALGVDYQHAETDNDNFYSFLGGGPINIYRPVYGNLPDIGAVTDFPSTTFEQVGVYVSDRVELGEHWIATGGARYDDLSTVTNDGDSSPRKDDAFTFDAGLMYRFDNGVAPYVSYAESFMPVGGTDFMNRPFDPVEGRQMEAGVKYQPPGTPYLFTAAVFDIEEQNRLTAAPGGIGSVQTGEVGIQGVELEAQTHWNRFYFQAGYSYVDATITESNDGDEGYHVAVVPDHQFSSWVTYRPGGKLEGFKVGLGVRHVGGSWDGAETIRTPSFTVVDAMVGYETGPWDFTVNINNLADEEYIASSLARGDAFYGLERRVVASIRYRF